VSTHRTTSGQNDLLDVEQAVRERYARASRQVEAELCCPTEYDPRYLEKLPQEILEKDYGCGDPSRHLNPGGLLLLSTPNVYCPHRYLYDATHCTPLCYDELAGLVQLAGLDVQAIYRTYHEPFLRKLVRRWAFGWLFRLLMLDYAPQIVLVARKPAQEQRQAA